MTPHSRAVFLLFAFLLHAGMGMVRVGADVTLGANHQHASCARGCCAGMEFSACGCVKNSTDPVKDPVSPLPTSSSPRDLIPQVAWATNESNLLPDNAIHKEITLLAWSIRNSALEVSSIPLTVKHCSFLH